MSVSKYRALFVGFGNIAAGVPGDARMKSAYRYSSHLDGVFSQRNIEVTAIIDPRKAALSSARSLIPSASTFTCVEEFIQNGMAVDVAIITTPPEDRLSVLSRLPSVKALVIEKPISQDYLTSKEIYRIIESSNTKLVEVNFWRRFVPEIFSLHSSGLSSLIGDVQAIRVLYGNGIRNNAIHLIDLIRFLCSEFAVIQALDVGINRQAGPIPADCDFSFSGILDTGVPVTFQPLNFEHVRENAIEFIGTKASLSLHNDGRALVLHPTREHQGLSGNREFAYDDAQPMSCNFDFAMRDLYAHLSRALENTCEPRSSLTSALKNEKVCQAAFDSMRDNGTKVYLN